MEDDKTLPPEEEKKQTEEAKNMWQIEKENWYDKVPLNLKQLDTIIWGGIVLLVLTFIVIFLDAADIFNPFGY